MEPSNWASGHSDRAAGVSCPRHDLFGDRTRHQRQIQHRLFPQRHDRPRQAHGACGHQSARDWTPPAPRDQRPSLRRLREASTAAASRWFGPVFESVEPPKLRCVDLEPRLLSLLELEPGDCRLSLWRRHGGGGHPRFAGIRGGRTSSYCHGAFPSDARPRRCAGTRRAAPPSLRIVEAA